MDARSRAAYKTVSLGLAVIFAVVGALFLIIPGETLAFFNALSRRAGLAEGPAGRSFFVVLAGAYMYVVTVLAWQMFRHPEDKTFPLLLGQAKLASAVLSFLMFAVHAPWLIYLVNGIVDGALALVVLALYLRVKAAGGGAGA